MNTFRDRWKYEHGDPSIKLWDYAVQQGWIDLPSPAWVLELGCCETDWHKWMKRADPEMRLDGVDVNPCPDYAGEFHRADAASMVPVGKSTTLWFAGSPCVDAVVLLGSLEHFGLGFYGDPENPDADTQALRHAAAMLNPGGFIYYDVPWTPHEYYITDNRHFRVYDDAALAERITPAGLVLEHQAWATGENPPPALVNERPDEPMAPFWYVVRLLRKPI